MLFGTNALGLTETYYKESRLDVPYREQAIIVGKEGFYPNRIIVYKGEKVKFFITSAGVDSACFNIPDKNVFTSPSKDKIVEAETFFDKVGIFTFNCPNNSHLGRVMVLEKASDRKESLRRGLSSDVVKVWQPKETPTEWVQIKRTELKEDFIDLDNDNKFETTPTKSNQREVIDFNGRELANESE